MILVFSGTGNTLAVARRLAGELGDSVREFTPEELTVPENAVFSSADGRVIWMFPTYSWGVPPVVLNLIAKATFDFPEDAVHYMVTTAGDDSGLIADQWRKALQARGIKGKNAYSVRMPNTYTMMKGFDVDSPEVVASKLSAMPGRVKEIASSIEAGTPGDNLVRGSWPWIKTRLIYP
ncbi:MAG: flavodoxin domain-containing protein [Muribaculaceae bacterium]|nr:flavodoxin domain-containing protein [Muribaculaceae bacterium]